MRRLSLPSLQFWSVLPDATADPHPLEAERARRQLRRIGCAARRGAGRTRLAGASINLYAITPTGYGEAPILLGSGSTHSKGNFTISGLPAIGSVSAPETERV